MQKLYISYTDEKQSRSTLNQIISLLSQSSHYSPDLNKVDKDVIFKCRVENGPISISYPSLLSGSSSLATDMWIYLICRSFSASTERLILVFISDTKKRMKGKGCSIRNTPFLEHHMSYSLTGHPKVKFAVCAYKHNENLKRTETESFEVVGGTEICLWAFIGKSLDGNTNRLSNWKVNGNSLSGTNNSIWIGPQYDFQAHRQSSTSTSWQTEQAITFEASPQPFLERNKTSVV